MAVRPIDANALHTVISAWPESIMYKDWVQSAIATVPTLTPPNEAEKAIQRLGDFGKLFLDYSGCPRGPMGEPGGSTIEEWVTMMEPICDVDGGWWRPVPEKALQILLCEMRSLKQAVPPDHFPDSTKMVQGPPNEPLTLEQLRQMDGEPVWIVDVGPHKWYGPGWAIVDRDNCLVRTAKNWNPVFFERYGERWLAFCRPPEGGTDA